MKQVTTQPWHIAPKGSLSGHIYGLLYIMFHSLVRKIGCGIDKAILDLLYLYELVDNRVDCTWLHIRYFIGYVFDICLQDTIQSTQL